MRTKTEFPVRCGVCGGPLMQVTTDVVFDKPRGHRLPVWVHARHRDYEGAPHAAEPLPEPLTAAVIEAGVVLRRTRRRTAAA